MSITTYAELQTAIGNWLVRDDLTDRAPEFIRLAEAQMQRDINHWRMESRTTDTANARFLAIPADFIAPIRLNITSTSYLDPLQLVDRQEMQDMRAYASDGTGVPTHYAMTAGQFEFYPTPSGSYTVEILYRRTIPPLTDANTTNWLLDLAPDAYLYGALLHSAPFLVEDARLATWGSLYSAAISALNGEGERGSFGGPLRMRIS